MYGGKIRNEGIEGKYDEEDFRNSYENEEDKGSKMFLMVWLHAYKYIYKDLIVKTKLPDWAVSEG